MPTSTKVSSKAGKLLENPKTPKNVKSVASKGMKTDVVVPAGVA